MKILILTMTMMMMMMIERLFIPIIHTMMMTMMMMMAHSSSPFASDAPSRSGTCYIAIEVQSHCSNLVTIIIIIIVFIKKMIVCNQ